MSLPGLPIFSGFVIGETPDRKYRLLGLLGEGGMGSVYEAEQEGTHRRVAVKVLNPDLLTPGSSMARRFRREARAAGDCNGHETSDQGLIPCPSP